MYKLDLQQEPPVPKDYRNQTNAWSQTDALPHPSNTTNKAASYRKVAKRFSVESWGTGASCSLHEPAS